MDTTICPKCRSSVSSGSKYCPECGAALNIAASSSTTHRKKTGTRDFLIVVGVLAVVTTAFFLLRDKPLPPTPPASQEAAKTSMAQEPAGHEMGMSAAFLDSLPKGYDSLVLLGNHFMDSGDFPIAAECYKRALAINDAFPDVRVDYGACLHGMGLPERAIEEFRAVIKQVPNHAIANFNLGIVFHEVKRDDSAKFYWQKYLSLEPNGRAAPAAKAFLKEIGG